MKIALVHDWFTTLGGAEKAFDKIYQLFPGEVYTLFQVPEIKTFFPSFPSKMHTSFLQKFPFFKNYYRNLLPFFPIAIEQFDLSPYDLVLSSSHAVAKGVLTHSEQVHVCYCYTPMRYAWDLYHSYLKLGGVIGGIKGAFARLALHYLRLWDYCSAQRVDFFLAISEYTARKIQKAYGRKSVVVYPPVEVKKFHVETKKEDFYVTLSRLVPYKRVKLVARAFSMLPQKKLFILGDGPELKGLRKEFRQYQNISFLGFQDQKDIQNYLKKAKAFVFAAQEDFGIVVVEAQACGTPVIAFGKGGALETVVPSKTGVFFKEPTPQSLLKAIEFFEEKKQTFSPYQIRENAERFSDKVFEKNYCAEIEKILEKKKIKK